MQLEMQFYGISLGVGLTNFPGKCLKFKKIPGWTPKTIFFYEKNTFTWNRRKTNFALKNYKINMAAKFSATKFSCITVDGNNRTMDEPIDWISAFPPFIDDLKILNNNELVSRNHYFNFDIYNCQNWITFRISCKSCRYILQYFRYEYIMHTFMLMMVYIQVFLV